MDLYMYRCIGPPRLHILRYRNRDALPRRPCIGIPSLSIFLSRSVCRLRTLAEACLLIYRYIPSQSHALR